jgi:DNA polymerase
MKPLPALHIDLETYCDVDIKEVGLYNYIEHPSFQILLMSYRFSDELFTSTVDFLAGEDIPTPIVNIILDQKRIKKAWNVIFEFKALKKHMAFKYKATLQFINWRCTMTKAAYNGYPLALDSASKALKLPMGKMAEGEKLIKFFCMPVKPTKKNDFEKRNYPFHAPDKWTLFKKYNSTDVDVEVAIDNLLINDLPPFEYELFMLDYAINSYGIKINSRFVQQANSLVNSHFQNLFELSKKISRIENPNSVPQLKKWIEQKDTVAWKKVQSEGKPSLNSETVDKLLALPGLDNDVREVLSIRKELSLSSVKKYATMLKMANIAGIIRGIVQFYGAYRTGRWAGRGVQVHNLPKQGDYKPKEITFMRKAIKPHNDVETLTMLFSDVLTTLKLLLRTAFIAREGHYLLIADWSAIEARIVAWLSNCKWRMEVFATHGKIYEASAAKMFKVPLEQIKKPSKERDKGKVSELALGYQGWVHALVKMGALEMGLTMDELPDIAGTWRQENPEIAHRQYGLWARCERAFKTAFEYPGKIIRFAEGRLAVQFKSRRLIFTLPSGRQLFYPDAQIIKGQIVYYGVDQVNKTWGKIQLYGGKILENAVQAIARDVLAEGLTKANRLYKTVMHVHDELILEVPVEVAPEKAIVAVEKIMNMTPVWAEGLILKSDIFTSPYYRKN